MRSRWIRPLLGITVGASLLAAGTTYAVRSASGADHDATVTAATPADPELVAQTAALKAAEKAMASPGRLLPDAVPGADVNMEPENPATEPTPTVEPTPTPTATPTGIETPSPEPTPPDEPTPTPTEVTPTATPTTTLPTTPTPSPTVPTPTVPTPTPPVSPPPPVPVDKKAPVGGYKLATTSVWIGQQVKLSDVNVADDVSTPAQIRRVVNWGDGTKSTLVGKTMGIKIYKKVGKFTISVTLIDKSGKSAKAKLSPAVVSVTKPAVKGKLSAKTVYNGQRFALTVSGVPAGTKKVQVRWGDGWVSNLSGKNNQKVGKSYYVKPDGQTIVRGTMSISVQLTNAKGAASAIAVAKMPIKKDSSKPVVRITKPANPTRVSSWKALRGTASDTGSGLALVGVVVSRVDTVGNGYCYTAGLRWVAVDPGGLCDPIQLKVTKGKWSLTLKGLTKGHLIAVPFAEDYAANGQLAQLVQPLTS